MQVPQFTCPQPSEIHPQSLPDWKQVVVGTQAHWPATLHFSVGRQVPHDFFWPQPMSTSPHSLLPQLPVGTQAHLCAASQLLPLVQVPHCSTLPQPSPISPQSAPLLLQVAGSHGLLPQRFGPAPPQNCPDGHGPQSITPPHPSGV